MTKVLGVAVGSESTDDERSVKKIVLVILYILLGAIAFVGAFVGGVSDSMRRRW